MGFATPYSDDARGSRTARIDPRCNPVYLGSDELGRAGEPDRRGGPAHKEM
jgi:hypothetical protein